MASRKKEEAKALFDAGFNCSQAVCAAYAADLGLRKEDALRVSAAFGGGIGRSGQTCGAVTGALMVLGLKYGMTAADPQAKEHMYQIAQDFLHRFAERQGSVECKVLLDADLSTPEGRAAARARNTHGTICTGLVEDATAILDEMLR